MKLLILTPWVPYPVTGACQQDRFWGMKQMQALGHELHVITKIHDFQPRQEIDSAFAKEGITFTMLPYVQSLPLLALRRLPRILACPALLDGAALEYTDSTYENVVLDTMYSYQPDCIWIEYSLLWPLLRLLKPFKIPIIIKSSLNEPLNCLDEHEHSFISRLKSLPKYPGERIAATESDMILAITPKEEHWYRSLGAKKTGVLPLRGLSQCFSDHQYKEKAVLDAVFLSSNYSMGHNCDALHFLLEVVIPRVRSKFPGKFRFHITGKKFPEWAKKCLADDVLSTGFLPDLGSFLSGMDIAVSPCATGQGMQQKVFEPLCRGLPLITHHTADYDFVDGREVLLRKDSEGFAQALGELQSLDRRRSIGQAGQEKARSLFSEEVVKGIIEKAIEAIVRTK